MSFNHTNGVPLKNAVMITYNVNLSFEMGTSHIYPTDTNETVFKDVKDVVEARTRDEDTNGRLQDICHEHNHEIRSGYSSNCMNNLGNSHRIRPYNKCIAGIQEKISSNATLGEKLLDNTLRYTSNRKV